MKFGGTSVADADAIGRVAHIIGRQVERQATGGRAPVVVVSALAGVTDWLIAAARLAEDGDAERASAGLAELLERHLAVASETTSGDRRAGLLAAVREDFAGVISLVRALSVLRE